MSDLSILLDRIWLTQQVLAIPLLLALGGAMICRARPATRASLVSVLAFACLLPWVAPVLAEPGPALAAARVDFTRTEIGAAQSTGTTGGASLLRIPDSIWLTGTALALLWLALGIVRARRWIASLSPAPAEIEASVAGLAAEIGVARPRLRIAEGPCSPAVFCLPVAVLVLPRILWERLPSETRDSLILHELAHLRRRDHWLRAIVGALCALTWWNPIAWLLRSILRKNSEKATDAWVARFRPDMREAYAQGLLTTQRQLLTAGPRVPRLALGALSPSARLLAGRIRSLFKKARPRSSLVGALFLFAVTGASAGLSLLSVQIVASPKQRTVSPHRNQIGMREVLGRLWLRVEGETRIELLPSYIEQLRSANSPKERRMAADDLGNLFEAGSPGVPALLHAMAHDESVSVREEAVDAIGRISRHMEKEVMPQLLDTLARDPSPKVRREVEDVLERFRESRR